MPQCTAHDLRCYFDSYGWRVDFDQESTFKTGWQGRDKRYSLNVIINQTFISFEVDQFLCLNGDWASTPEILVFLLDLNYRSHLVKLSIAESGAIALSSHALVDGFYFENLARTLEIVGYYCDLFHESIMNKLEEIEGSQTPLSCYITH